MTTMTLKLPEALNRQIEFVAKKRGRSKSHIVREALEQTLGEIRKGDENISCYDLVADLVGKGSGPRDLSTNPKYMEGFGR